MHSQARQLHVLRTVKIFLTFGKFWQANKYIWIPACANVRWNCPGVTGAVKDLIEHRTTFLGLLGR
jgi:hypothetical protein